MDGMYIPRPEDFRLAWPNAYSQAMRLAIDIQQCNQAQINIVKMVIQDCGTMSDRTLENIRKTGYVYIDEMRKAGAESKKSIDGAAAQFLKSVTTSLARDRGIRDEIRQEVQTLLEERRALEEFKTTLNARPLWVRLWLAFHSRY